MIGGGSAGAVIASRLSESGKHRVVLLEAGGATHPLSQVPVSYSYFMDRPGTNWLYKSEPEPGTHNRRIPVPRGRMLGGSSTINGNVWARGNARDYDHWRQLGNKGWGFGDVLPIFKSIEAYPDGDEQLRGRTGPVKITAVPCSGPIAPLYESFFRAAESVGLARSVDYNGEIQEGVGMTQGAVSAAGRRMSASECYLKPARGRANLVIITGATAQKLVIADGRCVSVHYRTESGLHSVTASREVILSAGVIASPQLLEQSGIGNADLLRQVGIDVVLNLPGVGENLRDHFAPRLKWAIGRHGVTYNEQARGLRKLGQGLAYVMAGKGLLAIPPGALRGFFKTDRRFEIPDAIFMLTPFVSTSNRKLAKEPGFSIATHQLRPESTGSVHIKSPDPAEKPAIRFGFLSESVDRDCVVAAVKMVRRIVEAPALRWLEPRETTPGPSIATDDDILDYAVRTAETTYHPVGTCKMGSDAMSVVDDRLRLHGVGNLRVADASIMPTLVSGNTNAATIMIGEKVSRFILDDA